MIFGLIAFASGILGGIGNIIAVIGAFSHSLFFMVLGAVLVIMSECFSLVVFWHQDELHKREFKRNLFGNIGSALAFPLLLGLLVFMSPQGKDLSFAGTVGVLALFKSVSIVIKATTTD